MSNTEHKEKLLIQTVTISVVTTPDVPALIKSVEDSGKKISTDPNNPTPVGHKFIYMVSDDPFGWDAKDPGNITLHARPGDTVSFFCTSMNTNINDAAFIYKISGGEPVLNPSIVNVVTMQGAAQPTAPTAYPFKTAAVTCSSCSTVVSQLGKAENFYVHAALFLPDSKNEKQELKGYVKWDPTVIVG